jgi:hypothetical protein
VKNDLAKVGISLALIAGAALVLGCTMPDAPLPDRAVNTVIEAKPKMDTALASGQFAKDNVALEWTASGTDLDYQLNVVVPNGCYSAKGNSSTVDDNGISNISVVLGYTPGICSQAQKSLLFEGVISGGATSKTIQLIVKDERSGSSSVNLIQR